MQALREAVARAERAMGEYSRLAKASPGAAPPPSLRREVREALRLFDAIPEEERLRPRAQALLAQAQSMDAELQAVDAALRRGEAEAPTDALPGPGDAGEAGALALQREAARHRLDTEIAERHVDECLEIGPQIIGELESQGQTLRQIYSRVLHVAGQARLGERTVADILSNERFLSWLLAGAAGAAVLLWLVLKLT